jgi:O-antigen ligase
MTDSTTLDLWATDPGQRLRARLFWALVLAFPLLLLSWEYFRAGLSLCTMALLALGIWHRCAAPPAAPGCPWWTPLRDIGLGWWAPTLFVWMLLPAWAYSDNTAEWAGRLQVKLPLLVLPLAFALLPKLDRPRMHVLFAVVLFALAFTNLSVGAYYVTHFDEIQDMLSRSQPVPTPIHHIRFSLLSGLAVLGGLEILRGGGFVAQKPLRWAVGVATLLVAVMVHVLAVRTGILALYGGLLAWGLSTAWNARQYQWALGTVAVLVLAPVAAYQLLPSVRAKVGLMRWNLERYRAGEIGQYSDTQRWVSYEVGLAIGNRSPLLGCGIGDVDDEIAREYAQRHPDVKPMLPHNQWLFFYAASGLLGVLLALAAFFSPLFFEKKYLDPLFWGFLSLMGISLMTETTLETAVGVGLYTFFLCVGLSARNPE